MTDHPADRDITRTATLIADLLGTLLPAAWSSPTAPLSASQQQESEGGHAGKPGSRAPMGLDLLAHFQTTLDEARTLCCDELDTYLANDRAEEALRRIPALLEATIGDCDSCLRCLHGERNGLCAANCADTDGAVIRHECECRHRVIARTIGQLYSKLRTSHGLQEPTRKFHHGVCPECGSPEVFAHEERVWCGDCNYVRSGGSFAIGVLMAAG